MLSKAENTAQSGKDEPQHVCYGLPLSATKWQYLNTKPPLSFRFISRVLKASECNSVDDFRCIHLSHSATFNFKGVDWKQNMYYEGGGLSPVNYRLSTGEGEKLPECNVLRSGSGPCFALLSSKDGLAGRSGGGIWKATFLAVTHWPECMIRLRVNKARSRDHSQLWLSQSGYHGNLTNCSI